MGCNSRSEEDPSTDDTVVDTSEAPEWEDGAPGATCPDEYDPDRVYVLMQRNRFQGNQQWILRDAEAPDIECSYKFEKNDFLDILVHPGRRAPVLSLETRDGIELRLPQPDPVARYEVDDWIWNFVVTAPFNDASLLELEDASFCGEKLRRWWPDATVTFHCQYDRWYDESGMPRFDVFDLNGSAGIFTLAGPRAISVDEIYDLVAAEQQGPSYVPVELDISSLTDLRSLHARTLTSGTQDAVLMQMRVSCDDCPSGSDLVLRRFLVSGDVIADERDYIWPRELSFDEPGQIVLDGEGRWVAHVQETAPDGRIFEQLIRGELDGTETVLFEAPLLLPEANDDETAIRIDRVFTGA